MDFSTPVSDLTRVGQAMEKQLAILGIHTVGDLLHYFPFRYEDYRNVVPIQSVEAGSEITIKGKIELIANKRSPRKRTIITEAVVSDATGRARVVWFRQPFLTKTLAVGDTVYLSGKVTRDMFGLSLVSPAYEKVRTDQAPTHTARVVPIYPLTAGITQKQLRFLMTQVMPLAEIVPDWLPPGIVARTGVVSYSRALRTIHFPEKPDDLAAAIRRLKFDELFILQLRAEMIRQSLKRTEAPSLHFYEQEVRDFVASLPFALTKDQKVSAWEIMQDMEKPEPMNRLLEGDVGSGKTVVAAMAGYLASLNGFQTVFMAPTEILANQHFASLQNIYKNVPVPLALLTANTAQIHDEELPKAKAAARRQLTERLEAGEIAVIVGTHALLTDDVLFRRLGLVIIDEQHRFGVAQRKTIREKSGTKYTPHFLSMTATPIPRSFALTLYGDLDLSIIREMPPGRKPIQTRLVEPKHREKAYAFIWDQIKMGRQVFVICPLIEEKNGVANVTASVEKKTVLKEYERLSKEIFPEMRVGFVHGKMPAKEKDAVMKQFAAGELDILVATSVIEVGVNIPNASVMLIEDAERFGLAELHQFRGRVGRSSHQSYCFLFTQSESQAARERLQYFEKTLDGFALAEYDLERRGPGEVYGTAQSGMMRFKLATMQDVDIIKTAREIARGIDVSQYPAMQERVEQWEQVVHLE